MWGAAAPDLPEGARCVMVVGSPAGTADTSAALSARADRVLFVGYGDLTAEGMADRLDERLQDPPPVRSLGVGEDVEPGDLTGQGMSIADALSPGTAVRLDRLDVLLADVDREPAFEFVHSLAEGCARASASMHVHLAVDAVDDRTVVALSTLMDAVVDVADDSVTVRPALTEAE